MATGYFSNGDPYIDIEVSNPLRWSKKLKCLIDTGFSGFLSIPLFEAFPIGLLLVGTMEVVLADGSKSHKLVCNGAAELDGQVVIGIIIIEPRSDQVLLGMDFLRKFDKKIVIDPISKVVELSPAATVSSTASAKPSIASPPSH